MAFIDEDEGGPQVFYLATCLDCSPPLPMPFSDPEDRHKWIQAHETIGHRITQSREIR